MVKETFYDKYPFYYEDEEKKSLVLNHFPLGRFIKQYIKEDSILVDVGCGCGIKAKYILDTVKVKNYTAIDFSIKSLEIAKANNHSIRAIHASALNIPLGDDFADIVISDGVIHHTDSPYTSFKEIARIAKKGAKIYISTYNREHLFYWAYRFASVLRFLRRIHLDILNKVIAFPPFYVFWMQLGTLMLYKKFKFIHVKEAWLTFNDNLMTPIARYYYRDEILLWCDVNKLKVLETTTYVYGQMLSYVLEKE